MQYAAITGWGSGVPPAVLTNDDLATFLDTSDEWITTRTGMKERRISHVSAIEMATLAASRALACAGVSADEVDLIVYGGCSNEEVVPNSASGVQVMLGARRAAAMDVNTACTSFIYGLSAATALIQNGTIRTAVVIGVELISRYLDWSNRNVAVLFGDGAAGVVVQASDRELGVVGSVLGCDADARRVLRVRGIGCGYAGLDITLGDTIWDFDGQAIFKRAVKGMSEACERVMRQVGVAGGDIDLVIPHQANLRIIEAVARQVGVSMERVMVTVQQYGNMSAATVPVSLVEALDRGRVRPGSLLLMPGFGGGLTYGALLVRWGDRLAPISESRLTFPPLTQTALEMVNAIRATQDPARSTAGLTSPVFAETRAQART
jgi:3-oxoacyl-[acyl-carrier-protein] synthase-3